MKKQRFGGAWTKDKLVRLQGYLKKYINILKKQEWAYTIYVDAFAGTGEIATKSSPTENSLFEEDEQKLQEFFDGSARIALMVEPSFDQYLFIERSPRNVQKLELLRHEFPAKKDHIKIEQADANDFLTTWIQNTNWKRKRAVMFLDPYGMQVEWRLLEKIAATKAIDLWLLVPIGLGVNRMMTGNALPPVVWQERLTAFFGTDEWKEKFYQPSSQNNLFSEASAQEKQADYDKLAEYFVERLQTIFGKEGVAPNPLTQYNSRNSPMFLLCFASTNKTGIRIADWLLTNKPKETKKD